MHKRRLSTKHIVYYAILMALNVVLTRVGSIRIGGGGVELVRIGFGGYPIIFAGIAFGPLAGGIVGTIGDIVGYFMSPMGPYMPHFTMTAALTGIIPGIIMMLFKENKNSFWELLVAIGIGQIITSVLLVPYFMKILFSIPLVTTIPGRAVSQVVQIPLYAFITQTIQKRLSILYANE